MVVARILTLAPSHLQKILILLAAPYYYTKLLYVSIMHSATGRALLAPANCHAQLFLLEVQALAAAQQTSLAPAPSWTDAEIKGELQMQIRAQTTSNSRRMW